MDKYRVPTELLPRELYRIEYSGRGTTYTPNEGFVAAHKTKIYKEGHEDEFKLDIVKQFTWGYRDPLPFITLFSDREHAENWGLKEPWRDKSPNASPCRWTLCIIKTELLGDAFFLRLSELVECLELEILGRAEQHVNGAYLFLHEVPASAIVDKRNHRQVEDDKYGRYLDRTYAAADYCDDLGGYSDGEYEVPQEN